MYTTVVCFNTGNIYTVTDTENIYRGTVAPGVAMYDRDETGFYSPVKHRTEYVINKRGSRKPSIYQRRPFSCRADEYKYQFTEKTTKTTTKETDVYYNSYRDRFISRSKVSTNYRQEYNTPRLIIW